MEHFIKTMLTLSIAGTLPAVMLMLVNRFLGKRMYSAFIYYAWLLVLLRFIIPVPGLLHLPGEKNYPDVTDARTEVVQTVPRTEWETWSDGKENTAFSAAPGYVGDLAAEKRPDTMTEDDSDSSAAVSAAPHSSVAADKENSKTVPIWTICLWCWAVGALCSAGWNLYGYYNFRRALYRTLIPARESDTQILNALHPWPWPVLYRSSAVSTPLLMGPIRPVIILPDRCYTPQMLDGILRHELTHYRRGDLIVKWFAAAVCSIHWFNPVVYLLRPAVDRACELSCDERLLRDMDRNEKQNYGEMLLALAAKQPLPRRVVAVSFATEKRNLKERLVQIMTFKKKGFAAIAVMLAVLVLLVGCVAAVGPDNAPAETAASMTDISAPPGSETETIYVDDVDSFLAALGSERKVILRDGSYDLTQAKDYGKSAAGAYSWEEVYDGYELVLNYVEQLTIASEKGPDAVSILTQPRYANVFRFEYCREITLDGITAGHTPEQGTCCGGVVYYEGCEDMTVNGSVLFGCGTVGITAINSRRIFADNTAIKECSYGAIETHSCYDVRFTNGKIYDCGLKTDWECMELLSADTTTGFAIHNTEIYGNDAIFFLNSHSSAGFEMRGCRVHDNKFDNGMIITGKAPVIDGCSFADNKLTTGWYSDPDSPAEDAEGSAIPENKLNYMEYAEYTKPYDGPAVVEPADVAFTIGEDGRKEYHVDNVDDFLGVIGSDRIIYLDGENFNLSKASDLGGYGGAYYYWVDVYDGPGLVITGVENLSIIGQGKDKTTVEVEPRYADVLSFLGCRGVTVEDLTAGHIRGLGSCSGDVIAFEGCESCSVISCGLFGCGVNGINAVSCRNLAIKDTEIYECSGFGAMLEDSTDVWFDGCSIHDCASNKIYADDNVYATWNGHTRAEDPEMFTTEW